MGLAAFPRVFSSAYRVAIVIEDSMNKYTGECFLSQEELAARSALSERQGREHLEALAKDGWIKILSGKECTRPKSKRGLHYRPTWPDEATRTRCMKREYLPAAGDKGSVKTGTVPPVSKVPKSGGKPPFSDELKTGQFSVAKPEAWRGKTGSRPPVS